MQGDHQPNPKRFQVFIQLPNGKGFRLKDSKYIYMFDKFGGWYDEYNNYYNQDGQPQDPPLDEDQDFQRTILASEFEQDDYDDYYEKQYGGNLTHHDDDYQDQKYLPNSQQIKVLQAIARNAANLHDYPLKTPLRVDFENMNFKTTKQEVLKYFRSKIQKGILNVVLTKEDGKLIGEGYFVLDDVPTAQKLIKFESQQFLGRKINFYVETAQNLLADPVTRQQRDIAINEDDFQSLVKEKPQQQNAKQESKNTKKKYTTKSHTEGKKQQKKVVGSQSKPQVVEQKPQVKEQKKVEKKQQEKKQPSWFKYQGDVSMFPKRISFKEWMTKNNFEQGIHYKNIEKIQTGNPNKKMASIEFRSDVFQKIEGQIYENHKVHFEKVN